MLNDELSQRRAHYSFIIPHSLFSWKVAGYGSPGRFAKPCDPERGYMGSNPMPSAHVPSPIGRGLGEGEYFAPMVKRTSSLASNEVFRVRVLVGVLKLPSPACGRGAGGEGGWEPLESLKNGEQGRK